MIFILLGLGATGHRQHAQDHQLLLDKIAAWLIIAMGVFFVSALFVPQLNREWHVEGLLERAGTGGPVVAGAAFGDRLDALHRPDARPPSSAPPRRPAPARTARLLLAVYSAGLAIPFLLTSVAFSRMTTAFAVVKRHYPVIMAIGGVILIAFGVAILTGWFDTFNRWAQDLLNSLGINFSADVLTPAGTGWPASSLDSVGPMPAKPTTCVIGAGISGLTAGKAFSDWGLPYTCFEASDDIGGNWYFGNPNGRSSAYQSLHIDTSRDGVSFRDMPMGPDEYPDYPHHAQILDYLHRYADAFSLRDRIRFETPGRPRRAQGRPAAGRSRSGMGPTEEFDFLVVGNGHHWDPRFPDFPGSFDGETIHSHHYIGPQDPLDLMGKRVLVVGIGNSAVDIVSELSRKGVAEKVFLSTRSGAWVMPKYFLGRPDGHDGEGQPPPAAEAAAPDGPHPAAARLRADGGLRPPPPQPQLPRGASDRLQRAAAAARLGRRGGQAQRPASSRATASASRTAASSRSTRSSTPPATRSPSPSSMRSSCRRRRTGFPLYKRIFKPGIDDLALIGFAQTIPTLFPFVELQSKLVARYAGGDYALPPIGGDGGDDPPRPADPLRELHRPPPAHDADRVVHVRARHLDAGDPGRT